MLTNIYDIHKFTNLCWHLTCFDLTFNGEIIVRERNRIENLEPKRALVRFIV